MSRILFAAARGARVQALDRNLSWISSSHCPLELSNDTRPYRIHWQDEHLQYGPVSSALRVMAENLDPSERCFAGIAFDGLFKVDWPCYDIMTYANADDLTRSLFFLILAESLADEGM